MKIKIPAVLRVKGFRLYLENGKRLVDLWLNGGAAVLGHTPANQLRELKNAASRGLYAPYPHFTKERYLKALSKLLPRYCFRLYAAPPPELVTLFKNGAAKIWRPFLDPASPFAADAPLLIPVLPGIHTWRDGLPLGLCVVAALDESVLAHLPPNDSLSPILLAVAVRGVHDILAAPQRANVVLPQVTKTLQNSCWRQQGIYLTLSEISDTQEWETRFNKFLEAGFLLPPTADQPLVLPWEISKGEEAKLAAVLG